MPELPLEIDVQTLQQLRNSAEPFVLLDVRTPAEHTTANITGAVLIPMQEIATRVGELEAHRQQRIVVHCHHGGRSARVTAWLRQQGFEQAQNLSGGIDAWSQQIDSQVPRY